MQRTMDQFPNPDDFRSTKTVAWRLLPEDVFKAQAVKDVSTRYGPSQVIRLITEAGVEYKAWVPASVQKVIEAREPPFYILNQGAVPYATDPNKFYYEVKCL